jgi:methylenetetrahydrofolate reductase (NADPH)
MVSTAPDHPLPMFHDAGRFRMMNHPGDSRAAPSPSGDLRGLAARLRFELVPVKSVEQAIADLPPGTPISVTCSPVKGLPSTLDLTARLLDAGHDAVPHLSARLVESRDHTARLAAWTRGHGLRTVFVVGGDAEVPIGPYADGLTFLRDLVEHDTGLAAVGMPAYPDGHALIGDDVLRTALYDKQALLATAGLRGSVTTQMCFDPARIRSWLSAERAAGLTLPVDLGIPGVVDRTRLLSMGMRLGVGSSLRYLRKNRASMGRMLAFGGYDPTDLTAALAEDAAELGITGLHAFTFNSVAATAAWQRAVVDEG